jgi:UDPglucose 6-dehydrogenase
MKLAVIGTGYVGLIAAACFADSGHDVIAVDTDEAKLDLLRQGKSPIYEPGIEDLLHANVGKRLHFTDSIGEALQGAHVAFIAVGTPQREDGSADLSYVLDAAKQVGRALTGPTLIVIKSTVPVGTNQRVFQLVREETAAEFEVVSNPEFLKQGHAVSDFLKPDRVVIGASSEAAAKVLIDLHTPFVRTGAPIHVMDPASAELAKYAANAMLASRISFMNEIAWLCEYTGANVDQIRRVLASDARIGPSFLFPGVGYGGSCFPKDVRALIHMAEEKGLDPRMMRAIDQTNVHQTGRWIAKILDVMGSVKGKRIAVWGLAFKPQTDDVREAPAIRLVQRLLEQGAQVQAYDPEAMGTASRVAFHEGEGLLVFSADAYAALEHAECLVLMTEWNEFRAPDFAKMQRLMYRPLIFDGRNIYNPATMRAEGFEYRSIGRL